MEQCERERLTKMLEIENELYESGKTAVAGVDEAGRGPLAGDVFAAAVILPEGLLIQGLNDSKKLSEKKRESLYDVIVNEAVCYGIGRATPAEIDELNIRNATFLAMNRAISSLLTRPDYVLIDGDGMKNLEIPHRCVIKGDSVSMSVAAASILAKVLRDRYMKDLSLKYPDYSFQKHKGYCTKEHVEKVLQYGPCPEHRQSFLKKMGKSR